MFPDVHLSKGTDIAHTYNLNCEIMEEIYNLVGFISELKAENQWSNQWAE